MPIRNCRILPIKADGCFVSIPIEIINPISKKVIKSFGIIDTGATDIAIPGYIGQLLGFDVYHGLPKDINTGNGPAQAFQHSCSMILYHPAHTPGTREFYRINSALMDFMPSLPVVLLGVNDFLINFNLTINYPRRLFSLIR
jgi:hypothetical protein